MREILGTTYEYLNILTKILLKEFFFVYCVLSLSVSFSKLFLF